MPLPKRDPTSIGSMTDRVSLQEPARPAADSYGQRPPAWNTVATVWACVEQESAPKLTQAETQREVTGYTVTIRYYAGLSSTWQLLFNGTTIFVKSVANPDGRKRFMEITGNSFGLPGGWSDAYHFG